MKISTVFLAGLGATVLCSPFALSAEACNGKALRAPITSINSAVTGTATICIGEDGVRGKLAADNLTAGHGYTSWFFYSHGQVSSDPGRFDSVVPEEDDATMRGHVGGLVVESGAMIRLFIFDHPSFGSSDVTRAENLLTPNGGSPVAKAVFIIP